jgi:hypothetical protein
MVAFSNEPWQKAILEISFKDCFAILKDIWIEMQIGNPERRIWRDYIKSYLQDKYDGTPDQAIIWCWGRIRMAERCLSESDSVPQRPSLIYISER